jgi:plastocyanin
MRPLARGLTVVSTALLVAACGGGGGGTTSVPPTGGGGATTVPSTGGGSAAVCAPASGTGTVTAGMEGQAFVPSTINAKVGDVITWTNGDGVPHGVALDDGDIKCTSSIAGGASGSTSFSAAGTYPFHCFVHPSMKGSFVIS